MGEQKRTAAAGRCPAGRHTYYLAKTRAADDGEARRPLLKDEGHKRSHHERPCELEPVVRAALGTDDHRPRANLSQRRRGGVGPRSQICWDRLRCGALVQVGKVDGDDIQDPALLCCANIRTLTVHAASIEK